MDRRSRVFTRSAGSGVYADVFHQDGTIQTRYFDPKQAFKAVMPVEFSVAAYRFGHSQVRKAYILLKGCGEITPHCGDGDNPKVQVFNGDRDDLHGGRQIAEITRSSGLISCPSTASPRPASPHRPSDGKCQPQDRHAAVERTFHTSGGGGARRGPFYPRSAQYSAGARVRAPERPGRRSTPGAEKT